MQNYDLFVIGGGSGGVRAARIAAGHGAHVGIAEAFRFGGTCVIRGCVPKKLLVYASKFSQEFAMAKNYGWQLGARQFDWSQLIAAKDNEIDRLEEIYKENLQKAGVTLYHGHAEFLDPHRLVINSENGAPAQQIHAKNILIATGAYPFKDTAIDGHEYAITSNELFHLERLPRRAAIYGGGYIAVEFAGILNGLGVETSLIYRGEAILRGFDDDLRNALQSALIDRKIDLRTHAQIRAIRPKGDGLSLALSDNGALETDIILMATGRKPNIAGLQTQKAGLRLNEKGAVIVDENSRSNIGHIYAVGDVTDRLNLTPVAIREGHAFADHLFGQGSAPVSHDLVPTAVFSQPEIGTAGLDEAAARGKYPDLDIYFTRFVPMRASFGGDSEKSMMKIIVDARSDTVLGVHLLGPDSGEMIQLLGICLKMGALKADFDKTVAVHPTSAEELVTMRKPVRKIRSGKDVAVD